MPEKDLPAAFAAQFSLSHAAWLITYPLAGWLGAISLTLAAVVLAVITIAATVAAVGLWPRNRALEPAATKTDTATPAR